MSIPTSPNIIISQYILIFKVCDMVRTSSWKIYIYIYIYLRIVLHCEHTFWIKMLFHTYVSSLCIQNTISQWNRQFFWKILILWHLKPKHHITKNTTLPLHNQCVLGPPHSRDWEPVTISLWALSLVEKAGPDKFASHYAQGTNGISECKMDVKSTWILTWHQMDHVSWLLGLFSKTTSWR